MKHSIYGNILPLYVYQYISVNESNQICSDDKKWSHNPCQKINTSFLVYTSIFEDHKLHTTTAIYSTTMCTMSGNIIIHNTQWYCNPQKILKYIFFFLLYDTDMY